MIFKKVTNAINNKENTLFAYKVINTNISLSQSALVRSWIRFSGAYAIDIVVYVITVGWQNRRKEAGMVIVVVVVIAVVNVGSS